MLNSAFICPHAPVMIPSIGSKGGIQGMQQTINHVLANCIEIAKSEPDIVVIMSQRAYIVPNAISVQLPEEEELFGSMADFGEEDCVGVKSDNDLGMRILNTAHQEDLKVLGQNNNSLDYGMVIPLYYLQKACQKKFKVVALAMSLESKKNHFEFGKVLSSVFAESKENIVFIAASELSHTVTKEALQGYMPDAKDFDAHAVKYLKAGMVENFLLMDSFDEDEFFCHGLRPIATLLGAIDRSHLKLNDISYEAPYGVGYLTALYNPG
ncbi:MAG: AmmeMemoRadiSam system protein B [Candidatus Peregrinibacteria bacterium]|nr:AmmeMemoRadiSam system protein B [Candidatus Peregrinibacteria bacterium]MDZ4245354.1 AmmeMemoRadiSam system protein B [Candidatus Gracilibacteria bacterium]